MKCVITAASEAHGRLIAYGGGTGLWVFSNEVAAKAQLAIDTAQDVVNAAPNSALTVSSFVALGGLFIVVARFAFDVFKYFDQRRQKRQQQQEPDQ